jgi:O-antigen/teichoic acid export membrane protein
MTELARTASESVGIVQRLRACLLSLVAGRGAGPAMAQTMFVRMLILSVNVFTGILSARLLGAAGKGEQTAIAMWPQLMPWCLTLGLPTALVYCTKRSSQRKGNYFTAALLLSGVVGLMACGLGWLLLPYWLSHLGGHVVFWSQICMLLVPYAMMSPLAQSIMEAHGKFAVENALVLAAAFSTVCILVVLGAAGVASPVTVAIAYLAGGVPAGVAGIVYATRLSRPTIRDLLTSAHELLHYGLRQYGSDLFVALSANVDQFLIAGFLPPKIVGVYIVLVSLCRVLNLILQSVYIVLFPTVVGKPLHTISEAVCCAARINTAISLVPAVLIGLSGAQLIQFVYGREFVTSSIVIWLLLGDTLLNGISRLLAQTMMAIGRPGVITILNALHFVIFIPLSLILLPRYQIVGVAAAMVVATSARVLLTVACYPRVLGLERPRLLLSLSDLKFVHNRLRELT